eukprot:SAG31_NODE_6097_length_2171_cov_39.703524_3_plen_400_part_00
MGLMEDASREFQFTYQEHVFRLRARTAEIQKQWIAHLLQYLRTLRYDEMIHSSFLTEIAPADTHKVYAFVQEGSMVISKADVLVASYDFPAQASENNQSARVKFKAAAGLAVRVQGKTREWSVVAVDEDESRAQIQMSGSAMKKWVDIDQLEAIDDMPEPEPEPQTSQTMADAVAMKVKLAHETMDAAPLMIVMNQLTDLQNGFDVDAESLSTDPTLEFQFLLKGQPKRFRVDNIETQRKWMHELQQEVAAATEGQDDAVSIIYKLLTPALEQLPVKDEDIHYILFFQNKDALALNDAEAEAAEAERAGFGAESLGDAALTAAYAEDMTPISEWLHSLGIRKYEEYARLMEEENELEMEDLQYLTEANLEEMGITAVGPRNRIMRCATDACTTVISKVC